MYVLNTAVTGFTFALVDKVDGTAVTSGTVTGYRTIDGGTQTALTNSPTHKGNGQWCVDLTSSEMNGATIGLLFTHADIVPLNINLATAPVDIAAIKTKTDYLPSAAAGANGGLPTVDANNRIAGVQGTITTLDTLNTGLSAQHSTTQADISNVEGIVTGTSALAAGADGFAATKAAVDATKAVTDALSPRLPGSGTLATGADVAAVSVSPTPVSQVPVPIVRTWRIKATSTGLIGEETRVLRVGDTRLFAADFLKDLPTNGRLIDCAFAIDDGTAGGITFASTATDPGVDKTQAKVSITGVTAGDYEIAVTATYQDADGGGTSTALVALKVVE